MAKRVVIGMSGGVDSSVAASLLKKQGYDCVGVFMKNWEETDESGICTAADDYQDVVRVCGKIGIPCYTVNFAKEYWNRVFTYFLDAYKKGRTPNPDVLCNKEIKFNAFLDFAVKLEADYLATGHYAGLDLATGRPRLLKAADKAKDQSYFLSTLSAAQLEKVLFPLAGLSKEEVRDIARKEGLSTSEKKGSTGICFIGERHFRAFLAQYLPARRGDILSLQGERLGTHEGAMYYTIGQRHGLGIGGKGEPKPWFVVGKDVEKNILYAAQGEHPLLYSRACVTEPFSWVAGSAPAQSFSCMAKFRYRQPDQPVDVEVTENGCVRANYVHQRAVTPGQVLVLYAGDVCLGGGVIDSVTPEN